MFQRSDLRAVNIPSTVNEVLESTFEGCINLQTVTLLNGTKTIGRNAFKNTGLMEIKIPRSLCSVEADALGSNCKKIYLPDGLQVITQSMMCYLNAQVFVVPRTVVAIEEGAFSKCQDLRTLVFQKDSALRKIGRGAFARTSVEQFTVPASLRVLESGVFYGCQKLKQVTFEEGIGVLGTDVFGGEDSVGVFEDSGVEKVLLPQSLLEIK